MNDDSRKENETARSLGIGDNLLRRWKQGFEEESTGDPLSTDEREELKCLRKEIRNLRMEKGILKKTSAYFAKKMK